MVVLNLQALEIFVDIVLIRHLRGKSKDDDDIESYQEELIYPCICKNAVHRECLNKWRKNRSESKLL